MMELSASIKAIVLMLIVSGITLLLILLFYYIALIVELWEQSRKNKKNDEVFQNNKLEKINLIDDKSHKKL